MALDTANITLPTSPQSGLTLVPRGNNTIIALWVGSDGYVCKRTATTDPSKGPMSPFTWTSTVDRYSSRKADPKSSITAALDPGSDVVLDVVYVRSDRTGLVFLSTYGFDNYFYESSVGVANPIPESASLSSFTLNNPAAKCFCWVASDGSIYSLMRSDRSKSFSNYRIAGPGTAAPNGALVSTVSPNGQYADLVFHTQAGGLRGISVTSKSFENNFTYGTSYNNYAPDGSCVPSKNNVTCIHTSVDKIAVFWIAADGSVRGKFWSFEKGWEPSGTESKQIAEPRRASPSGSLNVIVRYLGDIYSNIWFELLWTSPNGTFRTAQTYNNNFFGAPWEVLDCHMTVPKTQDSGPVAVANVNPNVTAVFSKTDAPTKDSAVLCRWYPIRSPGTYRTQRLSNEKSAKDFQSQLDIDLQKYHQVIAISQDYVNEVFRSRWRANDSLSKFEFETSSEQGRFRINVVLSPPKISLIDQADGGDGAVFSVPFKSGILSSPGQSDVSLDGWNLNFKVKFDHEDAPDLNSNLAGLGLEPGRLSAKRLLYSFASATLLDFGPEDSVSITGQNIALPKQLDARQIAAFHDFFKQYLNKLSSGDQKTISETVMGKPGADYGATFPPTSMRMETINYKNPEGGKARAGLNALLISQMTQNQDMPLSNLAWSGNWFSGAFATTFVLAREVFINDFLLDLLRIYCEALPNMANYCMYVVSVLPNYPDGIRAEKFIKNKPADWTYGRWEKHEDHALWRVSFLRHYFEDPRKTRMEPLVSNTVHYHAGSNAITMETTIQLKFGTRATQRADTPDGTERSGKISATWHTTVAFQKVSSTSSKLEVAIEQNLPVMVVEVDGDNGLRETIWHNLTGAFAVNIDKSGLTNSLEEGLKEKQALILPSHGELEFKDLFFNNRHDLVLQGTLKV